MSKWEGEKAVRRSAAAHCILRTSWVVSPYGSNFVKTMLRLGRERDALNIVSDQVGGPTGAGDIAAACLDIARQLVRHPERSGTYHFAGTPDTSWADFARAIFAAADIECEVKDITTADYPTPARRPLNSRLDCESTYQTFGLRRPDWRKTLEDILTELGVRQ
jgi:dTDP-4-dehydrorhamnose reductase